MNRYFLNKIGAGKVHQKAPAPHLYMYFLPGVLQRKYEKANKYMKTVAAGKKTAQSHQEICMKPCKCPAGMSRCGLQPLSYRGDPGRDLLKDVQQDADGVQRGEHSDPVHDGALADRRPIVIVNA